MSRRFADSSNPQARTSRPVAASTPTAVSYIALRELHGVIAELRQGDGGGKSLPRHFHEEYQIILSEHRLIQYHYRGGFRNSPPGALFVVHRGEPHSAEVLANIAPGAPLRTFLIPDSAFASLTSQKQPFRFPRLSSPIVKESDLFYQFARLHRAFFSGANPLTAGSLLFDTIASLGSWAVTVEGVRSHTVTNLERAPAAPDRVRRVREYLAVHWAERVDLTHLSAITGLSPFHLVRLFRREFGLPPHAYQIQLMEQTKLLKVPSEPCW